MFRAASCFYSLNTKAITALRKWSFQTHVHEELQFT